MKALGIELKALEQLDLLSGLTKTTLPFVFILIVIFAPAAEELFFRGLLLDWLRQRLAVTPAILICALVFGLMHGISVHSGASGWWQFGDRTAIGVVSGLLVVR